tara:strand:- start:272 stop:580 length:309 start_codon:yes stop_codon:yes gene_type:complete
MNRSAAKQELNRIERELDANEPPGGKPPVKRGGGGDDGGHSGKSANRSLDAVLVTALLLFVVAAALVFAGRLSSTQRMQLTAGSVGGAIGLLLGYGVGRLRP